MERIANYLGFALVVAGIVWVGYDYREHHLPEFAELKTMVTIQQCIDDCIQTCRDNGIPADRCDCGRCNVYR